MNDKEFREWATQISDGINQQLRADLLTHGPPLTEFPGLSQEVEMSDEQLFLGYNIKRDKFVEFKLTLGERLELERVAAKRDETISGVIRRALAKEIRGIQDEEDAIKSIAAQVTRMSQKLDALANALHAMNESGLRLLSGQEIFRIPRDNTGM